MQHTAQVNASTSVFHATPQRRGPLRQASPQTFSVSKREKSVEGAKAPEASSTDDWRIRSTGKNVNTATSTATVTTLPATNASPLK